MPSMAGKKVPAKHLRCLVNCKYQFWDKAWNSSVRMGGEVREIIVSSTLWKHMAHDGPTYIAILSVFSQLRCAARHQR